MFSRKPQLTLAEQLVAETEKTKSMAATKIATAVALTKELCVKRLHEVAKVSETPECILDFDASHAASTVIAGVIGLTVGQTQEVILAVGEYLKNEKLEVTNVSGDACSIRVAWKKPAPTPAPS